MKRTTQNEMIDSTSQQQDDSIAHLAASKIQRAFRGFIAPKLYRIQQLDSTKLESYNAFIVGNDPCMPEELANHAEHNKKIAIVGTSCLRNISIACELGKSLEHTSKIFIVDNSSQVHQFWQKFRAFMADDALTQTHALFTANLPQFLADTEDLCRQPSNQLLKNAWGGTVEFPDQDATNFMQSIIEKHGYERFRAVARHVSLIKQAFEDTQTFTKLRNIIKVLGIDTVYTYPSNLATLMIGQDAEAMLKNIQLLSPKLSIHVINDITRRGYLAPKEVKLIEDNRPDQVQTKLGLK